MRFIKTMQNKNFTGWIMIAVIAQLMMPCAGHAGDTMTPPHRGNWYGDHVYFGYHYDLHANETDRDLGANLSVDGLLEAFRIMEPDMIQTDTKGHNGSTSWYSTTPEATVATGIIRDGLKIWSTAAHEYGVPVQSHYSGLFDMAAGKKHPEWCVVQERRGSDKLDRAKMCPRSPYVDELLIPQVKEMIDRYDMDGFWIDGEIWAVQPCYCERCCTAFEDSYGISDPPTEQSDPRWPDWLAFTRHSFEDYVIHYVTEIHAYAPEVRVCSNWLHSFNHPGEPRVPTDFLSGDNLATLPEPNNFCEARFLSTRGRPWEIIVWGFYYNENSPWIIKPTDMIKQNIASIVALGGNSHIYNQPKAVRDGRLVPFHSQRIAEVSRFVKARKEWSQHTDSHPQAAVLHSEHHHYSQSIHNIYNYDTTNVQGAVYALVENSYGTDLMDEWALLARLDDFPLVVAPSQDNLSDAVVDSLKRYVERGGRLLLSGPGMFERFGGDFLGARSSSVISDPGYHIPADGGWIPLSSASHQGGAWTSVPVDSIRIVEPTTGTAAAYFSTTLMDEDVTDIPAVIVRSVGDGAVAYAPFPLFRYYNRSRYTLVRRFIEDIIDTLGPKMDIRISAPVTVETIMREKDGALVVHLINRSTGSPFSPNIAATEQVPPTGPVTVRLQLDREPASVRLLYEDALLTRDVIHTGDDGTVDMLVTVPQVRLHSALLIER